MEPREKSTINDTSEDINILPQDEELQKDADAGNTEANPRDTEGSTGEEIDRLKNEADLYKDKYVRLFAEFENYKRRSAKERMDTIQTAGREVIISMLDVVDDCDRAEKQMTVSEDVNAVKQGVQLVFNKLRTSLQAKGLRPMESINTEFDVERHEAVSEIEVADKSKKGKVIDEIVKGYYLNDKLIRFAKVIVAK